MATLYSWQSCECSTMLFIWITISTTDTVPLYSGLFTILSLQSRLDFGCSHFWKRGFVHDPCIQPKGYVFVSNNSAICCTSSLRKMINCVQKVWFKRDKSFQSSILILEDNPLWKNVRGKANENLNTDHKQAHWRMEHFCQSHRRWTNHLRLKLIVSLTYS